jgi:iron complex outermembrane recepter protein
VDFCSRPLGLRRLRYPGRTARTTLLAVALLALAPDLRAEPAPASGVGAIDEITVRGREEPLTAPSVEGARRLIETTPGGVDLVPSEEFRMGRAATLKDMLDFVPGVFAQPKYGEDSRFSIRGSGLSRNSHLRGVRLLVDGMPINAADGSGDFQEIEPLAVRYTEVYKGANALRLGASYLGGAVNLVMPTGNDASSLLGRFERGSFGYRRGQLASGQAGDRWDYFGSGTLIDQDGFREHSDQKNLRFAGNFGYRMSESAETRFYLIYNHVDQAIPGSRTRAQALGDPEDAAPNAVTLDQKRDIESFRFANRTTFELAPRVRLHLGAYGVSKHLVHPISVVVDNRYRDFGGFAQLQQEAELGGRETEWVFGVNLGGGNTDARRFGDLNSPRTRKTADAEERAATGEAYTEGRLHVTPALTLIAGGHYTRAVRSLDDRFLSDRRGDDSDRLHYREFSPRVGLLWSSDPRWQIFANWSRSAEVPTFSELNPTAASPLIGFNELETQKSITAEIGMRGRLEAVAWDVSLYHARLRDELQLVLLDPSDETSGTFAANARRTIHQGAEIGLGLRLAEGVLGGDDSLWLRQSYTWSAFRFDGDARYGDNDLPGAPRHYYRAELAYEHPSGFGLGVNVEWVPTPYFVDNVNQTKTERYVLLGAKARYRVNDRWDLFVDARNLTNRRYITSTSAVHRATPGLTIFNPGDGLGVFVGIEGRH